MDWIDVVLFLSLALVSEVIGTIGGFGSSLLFVPIASFFYDFESVLGITALFHVASNLSKIVLFKKGLSKSLLYQIGIPSIIGVLIGASLVEFFNVLFLELVLSVTLIVLSVFLFVFKDKKIKPKPLNAISGGAVSGFIAGLLGTGGAIRGITLAAYNLQVEVFIATSAFIDLGVDVSRSVVYSVNEFVHWHDLYILPFLVLIGIIGSYAGKVILSRISQERFKKIVLILIAGTGIAGIVKYFQLF